MMTRPRMYLLTGLSFSGKSTLAQAISTALSIPIVDPDRVAQEQGLGLNGESISDAEWTLIHKEAEQRAARILRLGSGLIYDTTAFSRRQREDLQDLAAHCGGEPQLVFVSISREEARQRWERNNQTRERFVVLKDDFARVADHFEPPSSDEPHLTYEAGQDLTQWIALHVKEQL